MIPLRKKERYKRLDASLEMENISSRKFQNNLGEISILEHAG